MKSLSKADHAKLRKALAAAYFEKDRDQDQPGELWQIRAMHRIRSLGPLRSKESDMELFGQFIWRVAPIACVLVLVLTAALTQIEFISDYEIAKIFIEDPSNFGLTSFFASF